MLVSLPYGYARLVRDRTCRYVADPSTALNSELNRRPKPPTRPSSIRCGATTDRSISRQQKPAGPTPKWLSSYGRGLGWAAEQNVCTPSRGQISKTFSLSLRVLYPRPRIRPGTRAGKCPRVTTTVTQIVSPSRNFALGVAWPPLRTAPNMRDGRTGTQCFSLLAGCSHYGDGSP